MPQMNPQIHKPKTKQSNPASYPTPAQKGDHNARQDPENATRQRTGQNMKKSLISQIVNVQTRISLRIHMTKYLWNQAVIKYT